MLQAGNTAGGLKQRGLSLRVIERRERWWLTGLGWTVVFFATIIVVVAWALWCESFLAATTRLPAPILVVEGWIGLEAIDAAAEEFRHGSYRYVIASGGPTSERWGSRQWNYAQMAARELAKAGLNKNQIITAPAPQTESQRTYASAVAVNKALHGQGLAVPAINVFTLGVHARRTRLIYARVFGRETHVGVIAWRPPAQRTGWWWQSTERAEEMITQSAGYLFELLLNSGRW